MAKGDAGGYRRQRVEVLPPSCPSTCQVAMLNGITGLGEIPIHEAKVHRPGVGVGVVGESIVHRTAAGVGVGRRAVGQGIGDRLTAWGHRLVGRLTRPVGEQSF